MNSNWTCTVVKCDIIPNLCQLSYYCKSHKLVIIPIYTTSNLVIQIPQISYYAPLNLSARPIWFQNQKPRLKLGPWSRSDEVRNSINKNLAQLCNIQRLGRYIAFYKSKHEGKLLHICNWKKTKKASSCEQVYFLVSSTPHGQ